MYNLKSRAAIKTATIKIMSFTKETAAAAGRKSKRGRSKKISFTQREFLFNILKQNQSKFQYMLDELSPRDFVATYMKLIS